MVGLARTVSRQREVELGDLPNRAGNKKTLRMLILGISMQSCIHPCRRA